MMYRAKTIEGNFWTHGYYVHLTDAKNNESHRIYCGYAESLPGQDGKRDFIGDFDEIDPDTLSMSTGLTDSNGKLIYEGDIVRYTRTNVRIEGRKSETIVEECRVYWDEKQACFRYRAKVSCGHVTGLLIFDDERADSVKTEVIGNIYEK